MQGKVSSCKGEWKTGHRWQNELVIHAQVLQWCNGTELQEGKSKPMLQVMLSEPVLTSPSELKETTTQQKTTIWIETITTPKGS